MGRESRQARRARERRQQQSRRQATGGLSPRWTIAIGVLALAALVAIVAAAIYGPAASSAGASNAAATATALSEETPVAGLAAGPARCSFNEMISAGFYHVHAHLALLHDGKQVTIPANIGFHWQDSCLYWTHTHSPSYGIIHIESPYKIVPTLGDFFKIWGVPLNSSQAWKYSGPMKVYVNQKPYTGDPANIKLHLHTDVTIEVGGPFTKPQKFDFAAYNV